MRSCLVVLSVHNGLEYVKPCLESVLRNTNPDVPILVVDDASTDRRTIEYLETLPRERVIQSRNKWNMGFPRTMNEVMTAWADCDVLMLNTDTIVPPSWVERMQRALYARPKTAGVCALSSNATLVSVPNSGENEWPKWLGVDDMDRIVNETSDHCYPELPTLHGFCMLLSRDAIEDLGVFDHAFGKGYGDETEWSLRAIAKGWKVLACDDLYVWHRSHATYGVEQRDKLSKNAIRIILDRYPHYPESVREWWNTSPLRAHKMRIFDRLRARPADGHRRVKVLYVVHNWDGWGGLEIYSRRMVKELCDEIEFSVAYPTRFPIGDDGYVDTETNGVLRLRMAQQLTDTEVWIGEFPLSNSNANVEHWFDEVLTGLQPDVVHFHHLGGWGTFELPAIAKRHGCATVMSLHDDFYLCSLLRIGGSCHKSGMSGNAECLECIQGNDRLCCHKQTTESDILRRLDGRLPAARAMAQHIDKVDAPSEYLKQTYMDIFGDRIEVIPHGVKVEPVVSLHHKSDKLRVGWIGAANDRKGFQAFADAAYELNGRQDIEWNVWGPLNNSVNVSKLSHVKFHGPFDAGTLGTWLQTIDLAVVPAMRNETYGSIVDEVASYGIPTLVGNVPAIHERLNSEHYPNVVEYEWGNGSELADIITGLARERHQHLPFVKLKSFEDNARDYLRIYLELTTMKGCDNVHSANGESFSGQHRLGAWFP